MVLIIVTLTQNSLTVDGHAARPDGAPAGNNIVCAAISALTLTLIEGLSAVAGMKIDKEERDGHVRVTWIQTNEKGQVLLDTWLIGMKCIRDSYGEITII